MGNLKVVLEEPSGNLKISIKNKFKVIVGIIHKDIGTAEIFYDPNYFLVDANKKVQYFGAEPYSRISWILIPIKQSNGKMAMNVTVKEGSLIQMCYFDLEIV